jgi:hypothetical protein
VHDARPAAQAVGSRFVLGVPEGQEVELIPSMTF